MIRTAAVALAAAAIAFPALAQPTAPPGAGPKGPPPGAGPQGGPPGGPPGGPRGPRQQVFISPAGEPFRAPRDAPYPVGVWFTAADTDHDGALTAAEFDADFARFFRTVDADHSGGIDGFEVSDYEHKIAPEILPRLYRDEDEDGPGDSPRDGPGGGHRGGPPGGGGPGGPGGGPPGRGGPPGGGPPSGGKGGERGPAVAASEGAGAYSLLNIPEPVSSANTDFNGQITPAEFKEAAKRRYRLLDKDGDGRLTLAELPKTPVQKVQEAPPVKPKKRGFFGRRS